MNTKTQRDDSWEKICSVRGFTVFRKVGTDLWSSTADSPEEIALVVNYLCEEGFLKEDVDWSWVD